MDSTGLIYNTKGKAVDIFQLISDDLGVSFPNVHHDVHGGCGVSWWTFQGREHKGYLQYLTDFIRERRNGPLAPPLCVGAEYRRIENMRYPIGVRGWARTLQAVSKQWSREVFQDGIREMVGNLGDEDVLGKELEAAPDGFNVHRFDEGTAAPTTAGLEKGSISPPAMEPSSSKFIAKHACLFLPEEFKPADMVSAATSTDVGAGGLTVHEGLVSFRFDVHSVLVIWDSLNSLFAAGGSTALLVDEAEYERVKATLCLALCAGSSQLPKALVHGVPGWGILALQGIIAV